MDTILPSTPAKDPKTIWVFTPSRTDPKDLEFILVQRQDLLKDAVERVRESALTDHKHHLLFVGPRGCGKTHLVTLLVSRLSGDKTLADRLRIAWLNEDETCTTLLELLLKIHAALEKRHPETYRADMLGAAYEQKEEEALDFVAKHLLASLGSRTLLVVAENLDAIFFGLGDVGQKKLRAFIQENPRLTIVATAQRLVEDLSSRTSPFFGFFQNEHLKPLNVVEATELLRNIALLHEKSAVVEFLATSRGRSRVRALHHLSGGNHRIYIVLSQFITRDSMDALLVPFMKMVDELTPYYQERVRWLPSLQRKIIELLCGCEGTMAVKEIAKRLFLAHATISSQLQNLREKGYVEAHQRGRESLYEISEPLMRICVEVKDNQGHQPLRLLVDFLRVWYDEHELKERLGKLDPASASSAYLESALQRNGVEGDLRKQLLLEDFQLSLPEQMNPLVREGLIRELSEQPEAIIPAMKAWGEGNKAEAISCLDEAIPQEATSHGNAQLHLARAQLHAASGNSEQARADYTAVIGFVGAPTEQVAMALVNRGIINGHASDTQRAIADFTAVIELAGAPAEQVVTALVNRGFIYGQARDTQHAIADFTTAVEFAGAPAEQVAMALFNRGVACGQAGDIPRAIADFTTVVDLPDAPAEQVATALVNRGVVYGQAGDTQHEMADYTAVIGLTGAPAEQVAMALFNRGITYSQAGGTQHAMADYTAVVGLAGAPTEQVAKALLNRGATYGKAGDTRRAMADFMAVVELTGAPAEQVAKALFNRGVAYRQAGDTRRAMADFTAVIGLADVPSEQLAMALFNRGFVFYLLSQKLEAQSDFEALFRLRDAPDKMIIDAHLTLAELHFGEGRWSEGFQTLEAGLERGANAQPPYLVPATALIGVVFSAGLNPEGRREKVSQLLRLYNEWQALSVLGEAVVQHLGSLILSGEPIPSSDNLENWASAWELAAESVPEFHLSLRLLRTGIAFVKAGGKDPGILLDLTSAERAILEQAFGLARTQK